MLRLLSSFVVVLSLDSIVSCDTVATADDLISLFNNATGNTLQTDIEVTADLDFSSSNLRRPLGAFFNGTCVAFSGVFQGNGHSIKGLKMRNKKNLGGYLDAGLFCSLKNATVDNLDIDSSCSFIGEWAGALSVSVNGSLTVTHVMNKASVCGTDSVGGFIGYVQYFLIYGNCFFFEDCANNGNVTGSHSSVGGLVGAIDDQESWGEMVISNSINNGNVTGDYGVGGFVGAIYSTTHMTNSISNSTNSGSVTASDHYAGGFVGVMYELFSSNTITFDFKNSANKGNVSTTQGKACGFVCVHSYNSNIVEITVKNSINKGSVSAATNGYGITNIITVAIVVVSMGDVTGPSGSFTFWDASRYVDLFFGLDGKCINCSDGATLFKHNTNTGFYEVVGTGEHVDDLLNDEVIKRYFGVTWTKELELDLPHIEPFSGGILHSLSMASIILTLVLTAFITPSQ